MLTPPDISCTRGLVPRTVEFMYLYTMNNQYKIIPHMHSLQCPHTSLSLRTPSLTTLLLPAVGSGSHLM